MKLTKKEKTAINALKNVAKIWPESLWLFSASGTLCVMKKKNGESVLTKDGGVDPGYIVDHIDIENDGGDF
ncbi:MAG: hypothetical protein GY749_48200 [Desulfobacteraceae bacterium]|nr:hypothetical protein [Desulfobacteraceae bacterium]